MQKNNSDFIASYYAQAAYYALENKETLAIKYLKLAMEKGFKDGQKLRSDSDFNNIKNASTFNDILQQLR